MKPTHLILALAALLAPAAHATIIYDASTNNVSPIVNAVAGTTAQSQNAGVLTISNTGSGNYNAGIASTDNINTLLGRPLLTTETVTLQLTVDNITGDLSANGFEFGFSPNNSGFRPAQNLIFQIRPNNQTAAVFNNAFDGGGPAGFGLNEVSVRDGFSATLTADQAGYTFEFDDVILSSGTAATYSGVFSTPAQFQSVIGGSHFYLTAQKTAADMDINISLARLNVIPEPGSAWLLSFGALVLLRFRRRL